MAKKTSRLELILPELGEFFDAWHTPLNENLEKIDDWTDDLFESLVGTSSSSTWSALRGSKDSLSERLDVSINADGTLNISSSEDILAIAVSAFFGQFGDPRARLDSGDEIVYESQSPIPDDRFSPMPGSGPSAGYPKSDLDSGMALRAADFGAHASAPVSSPQIPWAPGLVAGGASPLISAQGTGIVRINAGTTPAIFNIDGYIFRIREDIDFDFSLLSPSNDEYVWIYVERDGANYDNANFRYDGPGGGGVAAKDLRKLQSGSSGATSGSTFEDTGAQFNTAALGKVKEGDLLVIEGGAAAGAYAIDALDGTTPDTKLTIKGKFKADVSGVNWHVLDNAHPNIGAEVTDGTTTTLPSFAPGRVYIGRCRFKSGSNPDQVITFAKGGVYDSGWVVADASADFPWTEDHDLGAIPSRVDVFVRENAVGDAFEPVVERQIVTNVDETDTSLDSGDTKKATMLLPSLRFHATNTQVKLRLLNASTDPAKAAALFTDDGGSDHTTGEIRIIARR